jgi:hypothetical protein
MPKIPGIWPKIPKSHTALAGESDHYYHPGTHTSDLDKKIQSKKPRLSTPPSKSVLAAGKMGS